MPGLVAGTFSHSFPELDRLTMGFQDLPIEMIERVLNGERRASEGSGTLLWHNLSLTSVRTVGMVLLAGLQMLLWLQTQSDPLLPQVRSELHQFSWATRALEYCPQRVLVGTSTVFSSAVTVCLGTHITWDTQISFMLLVTCYSLMVICLIFSSLSVITLMGSFPRAGVTGPMPDHAESNFRETEHAVPNRKQFHVTGVMNHPNRISVNGASVGAGKRLQVLETSPAYAPESRSVPQFPKLLCCNHREPSSSHRLYILQTAKNEIFRHITWGRQIPDNSVEQGGLLLGRAFRDEEVGIMFGVVERAVAGSSARGTSAYLEMDHETWKAMIDKVDSVLEITPGSGLQIIGWYHTHPNTLDVFMSGTDKGTQQRFFACEWQFGVVLNPQRTIWRVFYGKDAQECQGFIVEA
ncbi:MAG: hypothetical protein V1792_03825 [Pseudomonadota bacterium]